MSTDLTGYGPSSQWKNLTFDGDERTFEIWETKILGYMKLRKLKDTLVGNDEVDQDKNEIAFAELIQFLDERSLSLVIREAKDDGRKAFKILRDFYAGDSKPRVITLYNQLTSLRKANLENVTDYLIRAEKAAMALRSANEQVSDSLLIAMVLKGLTDEYKPFVAIITQSETVDTFHRFKQALRNFEEMEIIRSSGISKKDSILKSKESKKPFTCYNCGITGHKSAECRRPKQPKWCNTCKSPSHSDQSCRKQNKKKHGADQAKKAAEDSDGEHSFQYMFKVEDNNSLYLETDNNRLLVDCGATTHIVNHDSNFISEDPSFIPADHFIELADGSRSNNIALKRGSILVKLHSKEGRAVNVKLENVLYIPSYPQNIFSVQSATKRGASVKFYQNRAELIASDGTTFEIEQQGRLYYLYKSSVNQQRKESLETWHKILGHCNIEDVKKLEHVVNGMHIRDQGTFDCEICTLAKQSNQRNHEADTRATKPFELVHTDLAGPIEPMAKDGFRYVIIFTDDYSGCLFTYFLKEKSDAPKATRKFLADVAPYGKVKTLNFYEDVLPSGEIKRMRSDNGGEFISKEFQEILLKHSIKQELSAPYSPHQNGTAERNWRTLFEMGRALLIESGLPKYLWTYAIMTATHIRNRCYVKRIGSTPYGIITGIKPNLSKMHIFGTICYAYLHNQKKLDPRSKMGYFVGYDKDSPSFLVFYPAEKSVKKHRLVKFTEKFKEEAVSDEPNKLFETPTSSDPKPHAEIPETDEPNMKDSEKPSANRYPTRNRRPPERFGEYLNEEILDDYDYDYCNYMNGPLTYQEAVNGVDAERWKQAMDEEINTLKANDSFVIAKIPDGKKAVGGKWVYTIKGDPDNPVYKARYVAKGYSQKQGIDYSETFSPTARMESVRTLMQLAIQNKWKLHQMDVKGAYLHAPIKSDVFVQQPLGYEQQGGNFVWKLNKSLYGLKQSGRNWNKLLHQYLTEMSFRQSNADPCVFSKTMGNEIIILLVWVDDIIIISSSSELLKSLKSKLSSRFNMKDLGELSSFLGIDFVITDDCITMSQSRYLSNVLQKF